jgi:flagella basal body P-ring formation protein FlgA
MTMKLTILAALCLLPGVAAAATLKPFTTLDRDTVRLSDLFDGADDRPLGPSPAPGARISVEAPQLTAIAHMFGVDWRSSGPGDRAILERPGHVLTKEDILPSLRAALLQAGAPADSEIELPAPSLAPLPAGTPPGLDYTGLEFDAGSGRFTTTLHVTAPGVPPVDARLSGRVQAMLELPVPRRAMMPGDVLTVADLQWTRLRLGIARGEVVRAAVQAVGQALRRPLLAGMPIPLADLGRPVIVMKGEPLVLSLDGPGIALTAQGVANEAGGVGERIQVINPYSRAVLEAEITGPGHARVLPGSIPTTTTRQVAER